MMEDAANYQVLSLKGSDLKVRSYKRRKAHSKLKSGCRTCKAKRVKVRPLSKIAILSSHSSSC